MDVARGEAVEKMLDAMIERRSRQKGPDEGSELWRQCVLRHNAVRSEQLRASWQKGGTISQAWSASGLFWRPS